MRTLRLHREPLAELTDADLAAVAGAAPTLDRLVNCVVVLDRLEYLSQDDPCPR